MICSFKSKPLKQFWEQGVTGGLPSKRVKQIKLILNELHTATGPEDLRRPAFRLHPLKGKRKGEWSVWVSGNYRITFRFVGRDVHDVDLEDYH